MSGITILARLALLILLGVDLILAVIHLMVVRRLRNVERNMPELKYMIRMSLGLGLYSAIEVGLVIALGSQLVAVVPLGMIVTVVLTSIKALPAITFGLWALGLYNQNSQGDGGST